MGTGDWNDGMNRVGREGRGESVWLGFFLYEVLAHFIPLCERRGDADRARRYETHRADLGVALNAGGWDGAWYRRAYYDDGTPLGSAQNSECRIDVLAQAWAVISGAAPPERAAQAMEAVDAQLVDRDAGLIHLLWPPFDRDSHDPGYIKGYVPGIRENGGQYTHGATWALRAFAELGRRDRAAAYLEMLSPVTHSATAERLAVYKVEPYVVVADIYGVDPHLGRGGWTWYTGSAAWMYRVALESVLGVRIEGGTTLVVDSWIPDEWPGFRVRLRLPGDGTQYEIAVENPDGRGAQVVSVTADGNAATVEDGLARVALIRDGGRHEVRVVLGAA
jgi:cyclic beta-1,2-glucan synthetase